VTKAQAAAALQRMYEDEVRLLPADADVSAVGIQVVLRANERPPLIPSVPTQRIDDADESDA
jgi:hypothetical protein